jgi:hypothetical protein
MRRCGKRLDEVLDAIIREMSHRAQQRRDKEHAEWNNSIESRRALREPCIRNLRLTVRRVLEALATYPDRAELKR